jgi:hypothetical protein
METTILITRTCQYANSLRSIFIFIDGQRVGSLRNGETKAFGVSPGSHEVCAKIDWSWSKPVRVELGASQTASLELGCFARGWRLLFGVFNPYFPGRYLYLRYA